ncbi:MAG: nucleotidyltransferase family protein [Chromatiales bacterium]|nr:nucleotidyltransferase family protein [Chromatiales bacterium]
MTESSQQTERANRLLLAALRTPETLPDWSLEDWDLLLRVARRTRLLGRLEALLAALDCLDAIPERAANHLRSARNLVRHRHTLLTWELNRILWATEGLDVPIIALKGVAYVLAELPAARGRFFADLDLLVPHADISTIETRLLERGWMRLPINPYDDRYYRVWMHEIPPLRHRERENEIDIHHRLLPRTSRLSFDPAPLFEQTRPVAGSRARVLAPHDMVLHALVHLFLEGDPQEGLRLRDLVDVADLLDHFGSEPGFWEGLAPRAEAFGLGRPLYYGLRFTRRLLNNEIPQPIIEATERWAPIWPLRVLMDHLVPLAILPGHPDHPRRRAALARWLLYVRAHWLRMPPWLLIRHIVYKAWLRVRGVPKRVELTPQDLKRL